MTNNNTAKHEASVLGAPRSCSLKFSLTSNASSVNGKVTTVEEEGYLEMEEQWHENNSTIQRTGFYEDFSTS